MAGNRTVVRGVTRGKRRKTFWLGINTADTVENNFAAAATTLVASLNAAALALRPFTMIRFIGDLWVMTDQTAATEFPFGAIGMAVGDDRAVTAGVASFPRPSTETADSDWVMHLNWACGIRFATAVGFDASPMNHFHYDQRGSRKLAIGDDLALLFQNLNNNDGGHFIWQGRILCLAN